MSTRVQHTQKLNLVFEARQAILLRAAKYANPENLDYEFEDADKWERHAINAVLDLAEAEKTCREMAEALKEIAKGEGAFSRDPLTHASNTIDSMKSIARAALEKVGQL